MDALSRLLGCCGCGHSEESSSRGQHQSRTDAVIIDRQPGLVEPPMVVRVANTVRQFTTRRRYPKPTREQLEALFLEGKELVRLQEEAEAAEKLRKEQEHHQRSQEQQSQDRGAGLLAKDPNQDPTKDAAVASPQPHATYDGPSDVFLENNINGNNNENGPPRPLPLAHLRPQRYFSDPGHYMGMRHISNHNDRPLPALAQIEEYTAVSEADTEDIAAILASGPDVACLTPSTSGTQRSKKMALFFQENRSESSVYPSDEEPMVYASGAWVNPLGSCRYPIPARSRLAVNKVRKNRSVSPGELEIPSIMELLSGYRSPSIVTEQIPLELEPLSPQKPVEQQISELPHPDEFELTDIILFPPLSDTEPENLNSLPHPDEFGFDEVLLTPMASPLLNPQPDRPISPIFSGAPYLKLEMERLRQRIDSETFYRTPWDRPTPTIITPSDTKPTQNNHSTLRNRTPRSAHFKNGPRHKEPTSTFGFLTIGSLSSLGALSSLSELSLASNLSVQAFRSTNSAILSQSGLESGSAFFSERVLAGLPPSTEADAPIHDTVLDATAGTLAESLRKGKETIAKSISGGFATLFRRFGARTAELQSGSEPLPTATSVPCEPARSAPSFVEGTPVLSPTPSTLTLMRRIVGLKVSGTLRVANKDAGEVMSNGHVTSGYTSCGPDDTPENPFEGFVWDAPDGKIPWYCDENGVHFDDKVSGGLRHFPSEFLRDPVIVPWEELSGKKHDLPVLPSTAAGPKGVRVRKLTPPAAAPSTVAVEVSSEITSLATAPAPTVSSVGCHIPSGSLRRSSGHETRPGIVSNSSSVDSFPRYIPVSHRDARHSTCGLDLGLERAFYQRYEDRMKAAVKPYMRGRRSFQRY